MSESEELSQEFIDELHQPAPVELDQRGRAARLLADPAAYAAAKGLPVEPGAVVRVDETPHDGLFTQLEVRTAWSGTPGEHVLLVPATPVVDLDELDEADLEAIAAGSVNVNVNVYVVIA